MSMRLRRPVTVTVLAILLIILLRNGQPDFGLDEGARPILASISGKLGVRLGGGGQYWSYLIADGELRPYALLPHAPREAISDTAPRNGARLLSAQPNIAFQGPYMVSPDQTLIVAGIVHRESNLYNATDFALGNLDLKKIIFMRKQEPRRFLNSIAWSPDSRLFAILEHTSRSKFTLKNILSSMSGHPIRYNTYYLTIYDREGNLVLQTSLASDLIGSWGEVVWFPAET